MRYFIPVFASEIEETKTLIVHSIPNERFSNKEEVFQKFKKMPWGSVSDYRLLKKTGWKVEFDFPTN